MSKLIDGFSLIELLIVLVVLSIVLGIGVPGYRQYIQRANRADGTTALLRIAAAQERFFIANGTYATTAQLAAAPPAGLGIDGTERGYYALAVAAAAGGIATGYTVSAAAIAGENQADDEDCQIFTVNERGQRAAFDGGGANTTEDCWR